MDDFKITKREILVCVAIIAILLTLGVLISGGIKNYFHDKNEVYNKAVKLDDPEMFQYGMRTSVGPAFVYGELAAVDPVTYSEIGGKYMHVERIREEYRRHTRTVTKTRVVNGKTQTYTDTEVYYTWDKVGEEELKCTTVSFGGAEFSVNKFSIPYTSYICTDKVSSKVRYKYYGTEAKHTGTIFTELKDNTISDKTPFYEDMNLEETVDYLSFGSSIAIGFFWFTWIVLIGLACFGFCYIDNHWLE